MYVERTRTPSYRRQSVDLSKTHYFIFWFSIEILFLVFSQTDTNTCMMMTNTMMMIHNSNIKMNHHHHHCIYFLVEIIRKCFFVLFLSLLVMDSFSSCSFLGQRIIIVNTKPTTRLSCWTMKIRVGILGLPNVGKSTLFNSLAKQSIAQAANFPFCTIDPNFAPVAIPDPYLKPLGEFTVRSIPFRHAIPSTKNPQGCLFLLFLLNFRTAHEQSLRQWNG